MQLFKDRNFLNYWIGQFVSVIGDHISIIAFPLLVLQMTESVSMTGLVFAVQGIPRAILMLVGGAVVDRVGARAVMMVTSVLRFGLVMVVAWLINVDQASLQIVFGLAFAFGVADAFFYPASTAIVPSLLSKDKLQAGNALVQGSMWVGVIVGPALAGLIIAGEITTMGHDANLEAATYASNRSGFARAFFVDGLTFAASFITLIFVRTRKGESNVNDSVPDSSLKASIGGEVMEVVRWVWSQPSMRLGFIGIAALEFFFQTPIFVGLPALAKARFLEPVYVYGLIITAYGSGALIGSFVGGSVRAIPDKYLIRVMFLVFMGSGASFGLMVLYEPYWWAMLVFFVCGTGDSFVWVNFTTWVQKQVPEKKIGRVMSILTFMSVGLIPIASVILGVAFEWNLEASLLIVSGILVVFCMVAACHKDAIFVRAEDGNITAMTEGKV